MLLQHLVSPLPRGATATPSDAGAPAGNDAAAYGLAALPPKVATAVQPRLAAVLRSATDPTQREASAWVLGEWATMPGACNTEVLTALTVALIGKRSENRRDRTHAQAEDLTVSVVAGDGTRGAAAGDSSVAVRAAAACALGNLGSALAVSTTWKAVATMH